jgi:hypothetical protein
MKSAKAPAGIPTATSPDTKTAAAPTTATLARSIIRTKEAMNVAEDRRAVQPAG